MLIEAPKPGHLFDRDAEWKGLVSFAADARPGATLGGVNGRRRQGKSYAACAEKGEATRPVRYALQRPRLSRNCRPKPRLTPARSFRDE